MMGIFSRNQKAAETLTVLQPTVVEQPCISADELERMVYTTYQEKLELERQLEDARERIKGLKEQTTKLKAAETFASQSESERKRADERIKDLQSQVRSSDERCKQERAKNRTLEIKVRELQDASSGRVDACRRELVEEMRNKASREAGAWSKGRVLEFLGGFLPETQEPPAGRGGDA